MYKDKYVDCLCQSRAILRHIGRTRNLYGATTAQSAYVDMLLDSVDDVRAAAGKLGWPPSSVPYVEEGSRDVNVGGRDLIGLL